MGTIHSTASVPWIPFGIPGVHIDPFGILMVWFHVAGNCTARLWRSRILLQRGEKCSYCVDVCMTVNSGLAWLEPALSPSSLNGNASGHQLSYSKRVPEQLTSLNKAFKQAFQTKNVGLTRTIRICSKWLIETSMQRARVYWMSLQYTDARSVAEHMTACTKIRLS